MSVFPLLSLSFDIRCIIYSFLDLDVMIQEKVEMVRRRPEKITLKTLFKKRVIPPLVPRHVVLHSMPPLSRVCRQLRTETLQWIPNRKCTLVLPWHNTSAEYRVFTSHFSWINYDMVTHVIVPEGNVADVFAIQRRCKALQTVIVVLFQVHWSSASEKEFLESVDVVRRRQQQQHQHEEEEYLCERERETPQGRLDGLGNDGRGRDEAAISEMFSNGEGTAWAEVDAILARSPRLNRGLTRNTLRIALEPSRTFALELQYALVLSQLGWYSSSHTTAVDWDTGEMTYTGGPRERNRCPRLEHSPKAEK